MKVVHLPEAKPLGGMDLKPETAWIRAVEETRNWHDGATRLEWRLSPAQSRSLATTRFAVLMRRSSMRSRSIRSGAQRQSGFSKPIKSRSCFTRALGIRIVHGIMLAHTALKAEVQQ